MADAENAVPLSKKRVAGRQLSRDNPGLDDEEEGSEQETGTFKRASDDVLAGRKIVKVRRHQTSSTPSAPSSNPFAGICLVLPTAASATPAEVTAEAGETVSDEGVEGKNDVNKEIEKEKEENDKESDKKVDVVVAESTADEKKTQVVDEANKAEIADEKAAEVNETENRKEEERTDSPRTESEDKKDASEENVEKSGETASFSSFHQLSSGQNAFTGLAGTGFSSSIFSFGSIPKDGSPLGSSSGSLFGLKSDPPSFGFGLSSNGNSSVFGNTVTSTASKNEGRSMQEVFVETGEENEKAVFTADSVLFEFLDGGWKERGKGELKVNVPTIGTGKARLVMRARGNYRLILNASLYPDMKLTNMDKKGITFACVNSIGEGKDGLSTFALKFKDVVIVEEFREAVEEHKAKVTHVALKTPENSPKASDD
ncbi:unnamed protein product [Ilex paraguariensis]|uniref:RanBD1 domain-containing protein n=1 Tax=Ilex paraguariensis TaxID=185542 RepID=A0ABC8U3J9_9AQUA